MTSPRADPASARILAAIHLAQATVFLLQPEPIVRAVVGPERRPPAAVVRTLGGRTLLQGIVDIVRPTRPVLRGGVAVDLAHAGSMLAAARVWPSFRRSCLVSAGAATLSAAIGAIAARTSDGRRHQV
jgi:hypothetical protein